MMGNRKEPEERKKEILDIAEELFIAKGYDNTSTTDILERVGIARGTMYYHFKSKEEILDALIDRVIQGIVRNVKSVLSYKATAPQKMILFVRASAILTNLSFFDSIIFAPFKLFRYYFTNKYCICQE